MFLIFLFFSFNVVVAKEIFLPLLQISRRMEDATVLMKREYVTRNPFCTDIQLTDPLITLCLREREKKIVVCVKKKFFRVNKLCESNKIHSLSLGHLED